MILGGFRSSLGSIDAQLGAASAAVVVTLPNILHTRTILLTPSRRSLSAQRVRLAIATTPGRITLGIDGD